MMLLTISIVLKLIKPPLADIVAEPIVSPRFILDIAKEPALEVNNEVDISGSLGSWLTVMVKSVKLSQSVLERDTFTVGENGIHATAPVLPPTQLPQLSINADPPATPLQSEHTIVKGKVCISISPVSEFIVEVNVKAPAPGFTNTL